MRYIRSFPVTVFFVILIFYLCLMTPPSTSLDDVSNIDKFFHFMMYFGTVTVFWIEYRRYTRKYSPWSLFWLYVVSLVCPILMSGVLELIQAYCTAGRRSGEWMDFVANSLGVICAFLIGKILTKRFV